MKIGDFLLVREELLRLIKTYPNEKTNEIFYGDWTIKEVIGHISAWDIYFANLLDSITSNNIIEPWGNIDDFNTKEVNKRKGKSMKVLIGELEETGKRFATCYKKLTVGELSKKIWKSKKYTPEDVLKIQTQHYKSQIGQISKRIR